MLVMQKKEGQPVPEEPQLSLREMSGLLQRIPTVASLTSDTGFFEEAEQTKNVLRQHATGSDTKLTPFRAKKIVLTRRLTDRNAHAIIQTSDDPGPECPELNCNNKLLPRNRVLIVVVENPKDWSQFVQFDATK